MEAMQVTTPDGINWHVKQFPESSTPSVRSPMYMILIPSGEGDCDSLISTATHIRATSPDSVVIAFDMPGFSRSKAPASAYASVTPSLVAGQIVTLMDTLSIPTASFWGSSSAGGAVLALTTLYPERVNCAIAHEVPLVAPPPFVAMKSESDAAIREYCRNTFVNFIEEENEGKRKWLALGGEYHERLDKNVIVWMRHLVGSYEPATMELISKDNFAGLKQRPLYWTVGGLSDLNSPLWKPNFEVAESIGLKINTDVLRSGHFPQVTIPETLAQWIVGCINKAAP